MYIRISNKIRIAGADSKFEKFIRDNYTIPNPDYIMRKRLNKYRFNTPKTLELFDEYRGGVFYLPYGCLNDIYDYVIKNCDLNSVEFESQLNDKVGVADWSGEDIELRPHQTPAVEAMVENKFGILKAPCSSGKTIMGHAMAKRIGMKTLWLTHTHELLNQSKAVGEMMLGKGERIGTITEGKVKIGSTITYATVQTMAALPPSVYKYEFNCVIVDECHRCNTKKASYQMSSVVNNICAEFKYGLSATPITFDGYGKTILCNLGDIKYEIEKSELEENNMIMPVQIKPIYTEWEYPEESYNANGVVNFNVAVTYLYADKVRNSQIVGLIGKRPTMILSSSIEQLVYIINEMSDEQVKRACLVSTKHDESILKKDILRTHTTHSREKYLEMLRNGELDIMFATYQLAKEGLNIPRLEQVIMAFPPVSPNIITQVIGRVARTCEGKETAICYDIVDKPYYFTDKFRARMRLYKKQGNIIT